MSRLEASKAALLGLIVEQRGAVTNVQVSARFL